MLNSRRPYTPPKLRDITDPAVIARLDELFSYERSEHRASKDASSPEPPPPRA